MCLPMVPMTSSMQISGLVLRKSLLGGPLVRRAYGICFHSPHLIAQERTFKALGTGPLWLWVHVAIWQRREPYPRKLCSLSGLHWSGNRNYPNYSSAPRGKPQEKAIWTSRENRGSPKHAFMFFSEESLLFHVLKTGPISVVLVSYPTTHKWELEGLRMDSRWRWEKLGMGNMCLKPPGPPGDP